MDSSDRLQKLGQDAYKRKDFRAALHSFNLILQLLKKDKIALEIYELGIRNVSSSDPNFKILHRLREHMSRTAKDPLAVLPTEIAKMIMEYLVFKQLVSLTCVSKTWRGFLQSIPSLWTRLDFSNARRSVPQRAVQQYIRHSQRQGNLLKKLPDIQELSLTNCDLETSLPTPGSAEMNQLRRLRLNKCQGLFYPEELPSLRALELVAFNDMLEFISDQEPDVRPMGFTEIAVPFCYTLCVEDLLRLVGSRTEELRKFSIAHCPFLSEFDLKSLVNTGLLDQVVDLDLSATQVTDKVVESLILRSPQLERINLCATKITGVAVKALITKPDNKLNYLDIRDCDRISADAIAFARATKGLTVQCSSSNIKRGKKIRFG
ncbi:MAG: hypothetical protein Q9201_007881 [Fulgogasparrea decipioides]